MHRSLSRFCSHPPAKHNRGRRWEPTGALCCTRRRRPTARRLVATPDLSTHRRYTDPRPLTSPHPIPRSCSVSVSFRTRLQGSFALARELSHWSTAVTGSGGVRGAIGFRTWFGRAQVLTAFPPGVGPESRAIQGAPTSRRRGTSATSDAELHGPSSDRSRCLLYAWRSSVSAVGETTAPSRMEQSVDVGGALRQLVRFGSHAPGDLCGSSAENRSACACRLRAGRVVSKHSAACRSP